MSDWPIRAGNVFVVAAFDRILRSMHGMSAVEVVHDPVDLSGYATLAFSRLRDAMMSGLLTSRVQPMSGGALQIKPPTDWVPASVRAAIATGKTSHGVERRRVSQWVFVDEAELALMCKVLDATHMVYDADEFGPLEQLGDIVLRNVPAIARQAPQDDPLASAEEIIRMFVPTGRFEFGSHDDRDRFIGAAARWLEQQFATDPDQKLPRGYFENLAERSFGHWMSGRIFEKAWNMTVAQPTTKEGEPDLQAPDPHKKRRTAGTRNSSL